MAPPSDSRPTTIADVEELVRVLEDESASAEAQVAAAIEILDIGWGEPHQPIVVIGDLVVAP